LSSMSLYPNKWVKKKKGEGNYANNSNHYVSNYNKVDKSC